MITKEKFELLQSYTKYHSTGITSSNASLTCLGSGVAGLVVSGLNDNDKIFELSLPEALKVLNVMVDKYCAQLKGYVV